MKSTQRLHRMQTPSNTMTGVDSVIHDLQPPAVGHQSANQRHAYIYLKRVMPALRAAPRKHLAAHPAWQWYAQQSCAEQIPLDCLPGFAQSKPERHGPESLP